MKTVKVASVEIDGDNLIVSGTVDGHPVQGHGWASRMNTAKSEDAKKRYLHELLLHAAPVHAHEIPIPPPPPEPELAPVPGDFPIHHGRIETEPETRTPPPWWKALDKLDLIPIGGAFIIGGILEHFLKW